MYIYVVVLAQGLRNFNIRDILKAFDNTNRDKNIPIEYTYYKPKVKSTYSKGITGIILVLQNPVAM